MRALTLLMNHTLHYIDCDKSDGVAVVVVVQCSKFRHSYGCFEGWFDRGFDLEPFWDDKAILPVCFCGLVADPFDAISWVVDAGLVGEPLDM